MFAITLAIAGGCIALCISLYGIHNALRDICLQFKQLRESLPTVSED